MHKGIILLIESVDKKDAIEKAREFLSEYQDQVWDWYQIGGRWSGTLAPMFNEFEKKIKSILKEEKGGFVSQQQVDKKQEKLQKLWESLKGKGANPYSNPYKLPDDGEFYDVIPLKKCIKKVKEWGQDVESAQEQLKDAERWLAKGGRKDKDGNPFDDWNMYGYSVKKAGELFSQDFCFDCNVYNVKAYNYSIPEDMNGFYAVMVDIHN